MSIMEMNEILRAVGEVKNECINIGGENFYNRRTSRAE